MGVCNEALISYGITIPLPKAVALFNALRKLPPPGEQLDWSTDELNEESYIENEYEWVEMITEMMEAQAAQYGFEWDKFGLDGVGDNDDCAGLIIYYRGVYEPGEGAADGASVSFWGRSSGRRVKELVIPWNDEEFMGPAKLAFQNLAKFPAFKEAGIDINPTWLHSVSVV